MTKQKNIQKIVPILLCCLLTTTLAAPITTASTPSIIKNTPITTPRSQTLFVGGTGPNNYTYIQHAIQNATPNDTIFIYNGYYQEHLTINKPLQIIGETQQHTIIDGNNTDDVIKITTEHVHITTCCIQNSGNTPLIDAGIESTASSTKITHCLIKENGQYGVGIYLNNSNHAIITNSTIIHNGLEGIYLDNSHHAQITKNTIRENGHCAIVLSQSAENHIVDNTLSHNHDAAISLWPQSHENIITQNRIHDNPYSGIGLWENANNNLITKNIIYNNQKYGIKLLKNTKNIIHTNTIYGSGLGIIIQNGTSIKILRNNFINNTNHAWFSNSTKIRWRKNYWENQRPLMPMLIFGEKTLHLLTKRTIPAINIDWRPAQKLIFI